MDIRPKKAIIVIMPNDQATWPKELKSSLRV